MQPLRTHYDDLNVTQDAPPEVIRAAYRTLAQRYHPDINRTSDAEHTMKIINEAYAVLSDAKRRANYDAWIEDQILKNVLDEAMADSEHSNVNQRTRSAKDTNSIKNPEEKLAGLSKWTGTSQGKRFWIFSFLGSVCVIWIVISDLSLGTLFSNKKTSYEVADSGQSLDAPIDEKILQQKPSRFVPTTPIEPNNEFIEFNGQLDSEKNSKNSTPDLNTKIQDQKPTKNFWGDDIVIENGKQQLAQQLDPDQQHSTGYVEGQPYTALRGLSEFSVDNSSGGGDAIVKLFQNGKRPAARTFFVLQGERFTATGLAPGIYVLRYRYMGNKATYEADQEFNLTEESTTEGTRYSTVEVTLYAVSNGNLKTKLVSEENF